MSAGLVTEFDIHSAAKPMYAHFRRCKQCRDGGYDFGPMENLCPQGRRMRRVAELVDLAWKTRNPVQWRKYNGQS